MPGWIRSVRTVPRLWPIQPCISCRAFTTSHASCERFRIDSLLARRESINNVEVNGWIRSARKQKRVTFAALGDGSSLDPLQAVLTPEQSAGLAHGTAVRVNGDWIASPGKGQHNELQVSSVSILGENDAENNPIQPKYQKADHLRTIPHLRAQVPTVALLLQLRSKLIAAITEWFDVQGFVQCHTPIITSADCEGAGEVFAVQSNEGIVSSSPEPAQPFFRSQKYLTVSAQLHLEALSQAMDKVWTLSPTFRAEKSDTPRHLSEFYMLEAEVCFVNDLNAIMDVVENMLRDVTTRLCATALVGQLFQSRHDVGEADAGSDTITEHLLRKRWDGLTATAWPRITYKDAIECLLVSKDHTFTIPPSFEDGLAAEHERFIATSVGKGKPVFVTDYPVEQKPFYMAPSGDNTVACFDLLVPDLCELVGGSLREHRLQPLNDIMDSKGVSGEGLEWYKDLRRYGSVPHGGFGLGFDRLICYLAGVANVRDVVSFPRYHGRCDC